MAKKSRKPQLKVVFDTNVLFTEVAMILKALLLAVGQLAKAMGRTPAIAFS